MAITPAQQSVGATATGTSLATAFSGPTSTGNGIVACVGSTGAGATSVTDPAGNTYAKVVEANFFGSPFASIWLCGNPTGFSGSVTAHFAGSTEAAVVATEVFGVLTTDTSNGAIANGTNAQPGPITTAGGDRILFGCLRDNTITASPAGFTSLYRADATDACYEVVTSIQTALNIQWTNTTGGYGAVVAAFSSTITSAPGTTGWTPKFRPPLPGQIDGLTFARRALPQTAAPRPNVGPGRGLLNPQVKKIPEPGHPDFLRRVSGHADQVADRLNSLTRTGQLQQAGLGQWVIRAGAHTDTRAPGALDDIVAGFLPGSAWLNTTTGKIYFCWANTANAATWIGPLG